MPDDRLSQVRNPGELNPSSEPVKIETDNVFDPELLNRPDPEFLNEMEEFLDNPMKPLVGLLSQYLERMAPKAFEPVKQEHKVRIFKLSALAKPKETSHIESAIESYLNDGYCCHMPTVVGDYVIMDFSRRKETEENERKQ
jgi:hypothetical protein